MSWLTLEWSTRNFVKLGILFFCRAGRGIADVDTFALEVGDWLPVLPEGFAASSYGRGLISLLLLPSFSASLISLLVVPGFWLTRPVG